MSDWIPVPEIENVLIVVTTLADTAEAIVETPGFALLSGLKTWQGGSVYVFHDPPEAGEVLEDADAEMAERFALAAQMTDLRTEVCRDAFRRMFNRATVQRVVLICTDDGPVAPESIDALYRELDSHHLVWAGEWPGRFALAMNTFHAEIFSDLDAGETSLRNVVEAVAAENGLKLKVLGELA